MSDGPRLFAHACKLGFEGIISKKADAPYRSERSGAWVKVKCVQRAKFPIVGFVKDPTGGQPGWYGNGDGGSSNPALSLGATVPKRNQ